MLFMAEIPERKRAVRSDSPKLERRTLDSWWPKILRILSKLGPGIVTGAADDDPSGIATYSQAGAQFGYTMLWTLLFSFPLMAGITGDQRMDRPRDRNRYRRQHPATLFGLGPLSSYRAAAGRQHY